MAPVTMPYIAPQGKRRPPQLQEADPSGEDSLRHTPFQVRNTFIDTCAQRSPSLEPFFQERQVRTCPPMHIGRFRRLFEDAPEVQPEVKRETSDAPLPPWRRRAATAHALKVCGAASAGSSVATSASRGSTPPHPPAQHQAPVPHIRLADAVVSDAVELRVGMPDACGQAAHPEPLSLLSAIGSPAVPYVPMDSRWQTQLEGRSGSSPAASGFSPAASGFSPAAAAPPAPPAGPAPGSAELPTVGSALHGTGRCKPCAFVHAAGCASGVACQFCHLCDPGEKKRRRKEKLEARRVHGDMRARRYARG